MNKCIYGLTRHLCKDDNCLRCLKLSIKGNTELMKIWSKNNKKNPRYIKATTMRYHLFLCPICNHENKEIVKRIVKWNYRCAYCNAHKICGIKGCPTCYNKTLGNFINMDNWSSKNTTDPMAINICSAKVCWFKCNKCEHEYQKQARGFAVDGCKYCASTRYLCSDEDCNRCFKSSFISHEKSKYWSESNNISPRHVSKCSTDIFKFNCPICKHEFETQPCRIIGLGNWCPYCTLRTGLCDNRDCQHCSNRSFNGHPKAKFWSDKNDKKPRDFLVSSTDLVFFKCEIGHIFQTRIKLIVSGSWCHLCVNKTESKLFNLLKNHFPDIQENLSFDWCINQETNYYLYFDFLPLPKKIVELDGDQHFRQISNWGNFEKCRKLDIYKMKCALDNGYSVIRILQTDVIKKKYNIKELVNVICSLTEPTLVFIGDNRYDNIIKELLRDDKYYLA